MNKMSLVSTIKFEVCHMADPDYRKHPALSNSDLSNAKYILAGIPRKLPFTAFRFGEMVHMNLLEPQRWEQHRQILDREEVASVEGLCYLLRQNGRLRKFLRKHYTRKEVCIFWRDPITGIFCKCKADLFRKNQLLADLKTTSATTPSSFKNACEKFDYGRQLAFYNSAVQVPELHLIGLSKKKEGAVFFQSYKADSQFIQKGKEEVHFLLEALANDPTLMASVLKARLR